MTLKYTKREVYAYVVACDEDDGPEDYDTAAAMFAAVFGRPVDDDDGGRHALWSSICAAVD